MVSGEAARSRWAGRRRRAVLLLTTTALLAGPLAGPAVAETRAGSAPAVPAVPAVPADAVPADAFQPAACAELGVADTALPAQLARLECGRLVVPERRDVAGGRTIRLAVVVARSAAAAPRPDPLVFAQGGPGGATIASYLTDPVIEGPLAAGHDVVLFDQRGTGVSEPSLSCPEVNDLVVRTIEQDVPTEEEGRLTVEALGACRDRLVAEDVDLAGYTTVENAADVEALRLALGYQQIDFYGVSYGTALGLEVLRRYPQGLRGVVLDGVVPPQANFNESVTVALNTAMTALFDACAADPHCAGAFPDLEATFTAQLQRLDREPVRVPMTDPTTGTTYQVPMRGDDLQTLFFQLLYVTPLLGTLPQLIHDVRDDRFDALGRIAGLFVFDRSVAYGMYFSVECAEDADVDPNAINVPGLRPAVAQLGVDSLRQFTASCGRWAVPSLSPGIDAPVTSDVPVLLLSGRFDPVTPATNATLAAATLSRAHAYTFPDSGHGAFGSEPCADEIVASFLDDPAARPRDGCLAQRSGPRFLAPGDVLRLPALLRLADPRGAEVVQLAVFAGALLTLLSAWVLLPLARLFGRLRGAGRAGPSSRLARWVPWLVVLDGAVLIGFVVAAVAAFAATGRTDQGVALLGLPVGLAWIFTLPAVSAVLAVMVPVGIALGWRGGGWSPWRRVYLSLLALAALSCAALVGVWSLG